jgi:hypothetical protein
LLVLLEIWYITGSPFIERVNLEVISLKDNQTLECQSRSLIVREGLTTRGEPFSGNVNLHRSSFALGVLVTGSEESPSYQVKNPFLFACQIPCVGSWMNRRMGFIVLSTISRSLKISI